MRKPLIEINYKNRICGEGIKATHQGGAGNGRRNV